MILHPASLNFEIVMLICSGSALVMFTVPPVTAAAVKMVPPSILSGITLCSVSWKGLFPCMSIYPVPAPVF